MPTNLLETIHDPSDLRRLPRPRPQRAVTGVGIGRDGIRVGFGLVRRRWQIGVNRPQGYAVLVDTRRAAAATKESA